MPSAIYSTSSSSSSKPWPRWILVTLGIALPLITLAPLLSLRPAAEMGQARSRPLHLRVGPLVSAQPPRAAFKEGFVLVVLQVLGRDSVQAPSISVITWSKKSFHRITFFAVVYYMSDLSPLQTSGLPSNGRSNDTRPFSMKSSGSSQTWPVFRR